MARQEVYYAEVRLGDGKIIARLEHLGRIQTEWNRSRHTSSDYELHILIGDGAVLKLDHGKLAVDADRGLLIPPNTPHRSESARGTMEHYFIHFSVEGSWLREALQEAVQVGNAENMSTEDFKR